MLPLALALMMTAGLQSAASQRSQAEVLARAGPTAEAMKLFVHIDETEPADVEARLWVARLALRLGLSGARAGNPLDQSVYAPVRYDSLTLQVIRDAFRFSGPGVADESLFLSNLPVINDVVAQVCRR